MLKYYSISNLKEFISTSDSSQLLVKFFMKHTKPKPSKLTLGENLGEKLQTNYFCQVLSLIIIKLNVKFTKLEMFSSVKLSKLLL